MIMKADSTYHQPVMAAEAVEGLAIRPHACYVDATYGGGGHSAHIMAQLGPQGRLFAFDRDADAWRYMPEDERFWAIHHDFTFMERFLRYGGQPQVDGILADLGVSSHQFDTGERGFSFRFEGPLDMRMDTQSGTTAAQLLQELQEDDLAQLLGRYGDVERPRRVARHLAAYRAHRPLDTTTALREAVEPLTMAPSKRHKFMARIFQALRIAVNNELQALETFLEQSVRCLRPGGRLVVISYHSAEDRQVKQFLQTGKLAGPLEKDVFGQPQRPLEPLHRKPYMAAEAEQERNPRARSARLRIAEKKAAA